MHKFGKNTEWYMKIDVVYNPAHTSRQKPEKHVVALSYSKSFSQKTKYSPYKQAT